ncbi:MAG: hypothetical protein ACC656_07000, partial [Candidatus Heimdallarchaeota archaeon]
IIILMSVLVQTRHSVQLLKHVTRHFNGVIGYNLIIINPNNIEVKFPVYPNSNESVIVALFTKLAGAFIIIKDRYLGKAERQKYVQVRFSKDEEYFIIKITGSLYIPPGKFLKLYSLILWYYVKYITGQKPSLTSKGKLMTDRWKNTEKNLRSEINSLPRKRIVSYSSHPCNLCGESTYMRNEWKLKSNRLSGGFRIDTYVCDKHVRKLI